jgi:RNA polymerase-interacting CarD/CdnL/TRCF family regulator
MGRSRRVGIETGRVPKASDERRDDRVGIPLRSAESYAALTRGEDPEALAESHRRLLATTRKTLAEELATAMEERVDLTERAKHK